MNLLNFNILGSKLLETIIKHCLNLTNTKLTSHFGCFLCLFLRYLAIDETDRMTEVNHFPELRSLLESINSDPAKRELRQNFVFSATLTLVHELPLHVKLSMF